MVIRADDRQSVHQRDYVFFIKAVIAARDRVDTAAQQLVRVCCGKAKASACVFGVCDDKVELEFSLKFGQILYNRASSSASDDIADKAHSSQICHQILSL